MLLLPTSTGTLLAVQPTTGRRLWEISLADDQRGDSIAALPGVVAPAVLADGVVYAAGFSNRLVALQARSGQAIWQASLGSAATPWVSGNMMYVVTPDGQVACLFRSNGKIRCVKKLPEAAVTA
jgi:outer membrane protein assembly factor BamB